MKKTLTTAQRIVIWVISIGLVIELLDATILNTALPVIALSLHDNPIDLKTALTSYLLDLLRNDLLSTMASLTHVVS